MSKRLMAIHEAFSNANSAPGPVPSLVLPNGNVNRNSKNNNLSNPCVAVTAKSFDDKVKVSISSNLSTTSTMSSSQSSQTQSSMSSVSSQNHPPPQAPKYQKPNSLILNPSTQKNLLHDFSNGSIKSSEDCSAVRLVQKPPPGGVASFYQESLI